MTRNPRDVPRGSGYWGKSWGVHRNTARRVMRWIRGHYGEKVVWTVGRQGHLVATHASLQIVQLLRAERNVILVMMGEQKTDAPGISAVVTPVTRVQAGIVKDHTDDMVTQEQFSRTIAELYRQIGELKNGRR